MKIIIAFILMLCCSNVLTQTISGSVIDDHENPVVFANIMLLSKSDSTFISGATTGDQGEFELDLRDATSGILKISSIGHRDVFQELIEGQDFYHLSIQSSTTDLDEIVVKGKKALYQLEQDRLVMNVGATPAMSGNSALQVLQKAPGVIVDRQANSISLNSKGGVLVMINNKIQRIPMAVLITQLEGMQAENIERIELIHQPGAKYDASGAAGIIHIVLKKNQTEGTHYTANLMSGYGQGAKLAGRLGFSTRKNGLNVFGDLGSNYGRSEQYQVDHFREYDHGGNDYAYENLLSLGGFETANHSANLGVDLELGDRTTFGAQLSYARMAQLVKNAVSVSEGTLNGDRTDQLQFALAPETRMQSAFANLNVLHQINARSSLNFDLDYATLDFDNSSVIRNEIDPDQTILTDRQTPINIWTAKADYTQSIAGGKLELGAKGTYSNIRSKALVTNLHDDQWIGSSLFSGSDQIEERVLAAYGSFSKDFTTRMAGEFGLRYEHFEYLLDAMNESNSLDQTFDNVFPIVRLNYKIDSSTTLQATFNRTITRPDFRSLSAFFLFLDPSILAYSNPRLKPAFTSTYKISFQHRSIIASLAYLRTINGLYWYNTVDKPNHLQLTSPQNLDLKEVIEATIGFPTRLADWWEMNWNLSAMYHSVVAKTNRPAVFKNDIVTYTAQLSSTFQFGNDWSASFDGRFMSDFIVGDQEQYLYPYLNLGLRKSFPGGSTLSLSLQDITNSIGRKSWEYNQPNLGVRTFGDNDFSERQVRLTYTTTFGNKELTSKRQRKTGAQEVRARM